MKKLGCLLLLFLNFFINIFLLLIVVFLGMWLFWDIPPEQSVQRTMNWVERRWDTLVGRIPTERTELMSDEMRARAHRNMYVEEENKKRQRKVTQPYKHELNLEKK